MLRVLMVLEDYGELLFLQTVLKKIGFDVDAIQNPRMFQDHYLQMNPEVLVMTGLGKRVKGLDLARSVRKNRGLPHVILVKSQGQLEEPDASVNAWVEAPVSAVNIINVIADLAALDKGLLQDKFQKLQLQQHDPETARILKMNTSGEPILDKSQGADGNFGKLQDSSLSTEERKARYSKFLETKLPGKEGYAIKQVQEQVKALRKEESVADLEELEKQRREFVEQLFKKGS